MWAFIIQEAESLFQDLETAEVETANDVIILNPVYIDPLFTTL